MGSIDQRSPYGNRYSNDTLIRDVANPEHLLSMWASVFGRGRSGGAGPTPTAETDGPQ
jgi:hypothetical protein